ncbi:MAG: C10 family peptidase [Candidatus Marinimicrobia bacterium]|nr:C10 family peptidase [Candidatus Neomarinimicrobiota bacterium]
MLSGFLLGAKVQLDVAEVVARSVYLGHSNLHDGSEFNLLSVETIKNEDLDLIYIFHLNPEGFIMIPADNQAVPVLAFGFEDAFESSNMPSNLQYVMNQYKLELLEMVNNQSSPDLEISIQWDYYLSGSVEQARSREVTPLIDAKFDQSGSWNNGVTSAIGFNGPVGCVAVAMSQIMHYWKYPEEGQGSNYYTENDYGYIEVDFEDANYDFGNMAATYATSSSQLLLYHAGVAVNMDYDYSGSGAWVVGGHPSAYYALENFFAYSSDISYEWKVNHTDNDYRDIIINELDNNRPVISQGYDNGGYGGHAWNIDGYSGSNLHCNWGWGGSSNGYFSLTTMGGFPNDQAVIIGILPQMAAPVALFEYEVIDETVTFIDLSNVVNEVTLNTWLWDFGDGNTSFNSNPEHTFEFGGEFEVTLVVTNIYGMISEPHTESVLIQSGMQGDVNGDSVLNILDIVIVSNFVLGSDTPTASEFSMADMNNDGVLNILDIVTLTNLILEA